MPAGLHPHNDFSSPLLPHTIQYRAPSFSRTPVSLKPSTLRGRICSATQRVRTLRACKRFHRNVNRNQIRSSGTMPVRHGSFCAHHRAQNRARRAASGKSSSGLCGLFPTGQSSPFKGCWCLLVLRPPGFRLPHVLIVMSSARSVLVHVLVDGPSSVP